MNGHDSRKNVEKKFHDEFFSGSRHVRKKQEIFYAKRIQNLKLAYVMKKFANIREKKYLFMVLVNITALLMNSTRGELLSQQ